MGVDPTVLRAFAYQRPADLNYKHRPFQKRNGAYRSLAIPHATLKKIQGKIAEQLATLYRPSSRAFAYIQGRDIRGNAATHLRHRLIFTIDLVNFFDQINFGRVRGRLMAKPYSLSDAVATTIARLTVLDDKLPFGAPSSPIISNMICSALDAELAALGRETGSFYTRYADDIVFSTQKGRFAYQVVTLGEADGVPQVVPGAELEAIIQRHGFQINAAKTRLKTRQDSQVICGVQVNEKLNVRRALRREIRALLHAWRKFGSEKVQKMWVEQYGNPAERHFEASLRGKIEFMRHIRGENDEVTFAAVEQFNLLASGPPIKYEKPVDWRDSLHSRICLIQAESGDMDSEGARGTQGSGFVIEGGFIVTNAHVACYGDGTPLEKIEVRFADIMLGGLAVEVIKASTAIDLAVLRVTDAAFAAIMPSRALKVRAGAYPETGETLTLTGYPNYQDHDSVHIAETHVTGRSKLYGLHVFRIAANVIYGNSGGPVLNGKGEVVGVAVCGSGINDAPYTIHNGAIPMREAQAFLASALQQTVTSPKGETP